MINSHYGEERENINIPHSPMLVLQTFWALNVNEMFISLIIHQVLRKGVFIQSASTNTTDSYHLAKAGTGLLDKPMYNPVSSSEEQRTEKSTYTDKGSSVDKVLRFRFTQDLMRCARIRPSVGITASFACGAFPQFSEALSVVHFGPSTCRTPR